MEIYEFIINNKRLVLFYIVILLLLYICHKYWENKKIEKFDNTEHNSDNNEILIFFNGDINDILVLMYFLENNKKVRLLFKNKIANQLKDYYLNILKTIKDNYPDFNNKILVPYTINDDDMNNNIEFNKNVKKLLNKNDKYFKELKNNIMYKDNLIMLIDLYKYSLYHNSIINLPVTKKLEKDKELIEYYKNNRLTHLVFKRVKLITNIKKIKNGLSNNYNNIIRFNLSCKNINYKTGVRCGKCYNCKKYKSLQLKMKYA